MSTLSRCLATACLAVAMAACSNEQAYGAGYATGRGLLVGVVVFLLILVFGVLPFKFGPALRRRKRLGAWFLAGGHGLAVLCWALILAVEVGVLRVPFAILGIAMVVVGHVGLWIVVLGLKPGVSKMTFDAALAGEAREVSPAMHALAQGTIILMGLLVLAGGLVFFALQATG
ncbi:MAG TPA: hypothetical protein VMT16_00445 [Thermoanaerobaculia bacterium]|nr:hypothetical protein [Thermoanaerobaculia bacterium]